jgi:hypothetical protein
VTCLGFGIDAYHGVNHVQVLEDLAALDRDGGYLAALSTPSGSREAALYHDAVAAAQAATPQRPSIVNGQIAAALSGESGETSFTRRISGPTIFVRVAEVDRLVAVGATRVGNENPRGQS